MFYNDKFFNSIDVHALLRGMDRLSSLKSNIETNLWDLYYDLKYSFKFDYLSSNLERDYWHNLIQGYYKGRIDSRIPRVSESMRASAEIALSKMQDIFEAYKAWKIESSSESVFYLNLYKNGTKVTISEKFDEIEEAKMNQKDKFWTRVRVEL